MLALPRTRREVTLVEVGDGLVHVLQMLDVTRCRVMHARVTVVERPVTCLRCLSIEVALVTIGDGSVHIVDGEHALVTLRKNLGRTRCGTLFSMRGARWRDLAVPDGTPVHDVLASCTRCAIG